MTEQVSTDGNRLRAALSALEVDPDEAIEDLAAMLELMALPSRLPAATRYLSLEWLGARDSATFDNRRLRHHDLMGVICRVTAVDVVTDLTLSDTGMMLGIEIAGVAELVNSGRLWTYDAGRGPRVPTWQLVRDSLEQPVRLLGEGLSGVVAAIPDDAVPSLVRRVMTTEDATLRQSDGVPSTPAEWIARGHSPWPVIAILLRFFSGNSDRASPLLFEPGMHWNR